MGDEGWDVESVNAVHVYLSPLNDMSDRMGAASKQPLNVEETSYHTRYARDTNKIANMSEVSNSGHGARPVATRIRLAGWRTLRWK